jgi:hypothetical protein|tara:strand:+ start:167 stop:562 length:396 start_codon:yes stop_codon:yes gene_type:complete
MLFGHGSISEFAIASVRGGGVQNVGSPFVSGLSFSVNLGDESVITSVSISQTGTSLASTFSLGTETVAASANVSTSTAGQITIGLGEETTFGEAFQNVINFSVGDPSFFIWNEVDDSQTITWVDVEPGSTD